MTKIVYKIADSGEAQNLRFSPDRLALESDEIELPFTDKLPDIETLHEKKWLDHLASIKYKTDRSKEYPTLNEQFDLLWHAIDEGTLDKTSDFYTALKKVKDDNPKP